jgi:hypothetical protein
MLTTTDVVSTGDALGDERADGDAPGLPPLVVVPPRVARKMPPPIARTRRIAMAMIAGFSQDGRSDGVVSTGRRTPLGARPGLVVDADSSTGAGMKVGRSVLEAGVHVCSGTSRARGGGVTGSKYGACGGTGGKSGGGS